MAFRLVKDVLWLPDHYSFYGEAELRCLAKERGNDEKELRNAIWLLRLSATLCLRTFYSPEKPDRLTERALMLAACRPVADIRTASLLLDLEGRIGSETAEEFLHVADRALWTTGTGCRAASGHLTLIFPNFRIILSRTGMGGTEYDF